MSIFFVCSRADYSYDFFCCIIILHLETWRVLNIISRTKTNFPGLAFSVVLYVLRIPYASAYHTTVQSNSKSSDSSNPLVHTIFLIFDVLYPQYN